VINIYRFFLVFISASIFLTQKKLLSIFGPDLTIDQMIFHLFTGSEGIKGSDIYVINKFIKYSLVIPLAIASIVTLTLHLLKNRHHIDLILSFIKRFSAILEKLAYKKLTYFYLLMVVLISTLFNLKFIDFVKNYFGKDVFSEIYINPKDLQFTAPKNNKNIILIYIESLEIGFSNKEIYNKNLILDIDNITGEKLKLVQAAGVSWSLAGMTASQCSVPLKPIYGNLMDKKEGFLPGLMCFGDVLKKYGYEQYYIVGSDIKFAGTDKLFSNHGYQYLYGMDEFKELGVHREEFNGWGYGLHDDILLLEAKKIIKKAQNNNKPFNINIFMVDTHAPEGVASPRCTVDEKLLGFRGAFMCSSRLLGNFIEDLKKDGLLDNTIVILMGDHNFMNNEKQAMYFPEPRFVYFKILNNEKKVTRDILTHFDVAPTILDELGVLNNNDKSFGLGISIFSPITGDEYMQHHRKVIDKSIVNRSVVYNKFWSK
jgi:phosphoglycerol transferase